MKKTLSLLILIAGIFFIGLTLYLFEIPPFQPGGPFSSPANIKTQTTQEEEQKKLPDFLKEEENAGNKTYDDYIQRAKLLESNNFPKLAIAEYQAAAKLAPNLAAPFIAISKIYLKQDDILQAKIAAETAARIAPSDTGAQLLFAKTLIKERKFDDAKGVLDRIPNHNQETKFYQAIITAYTGDHGKAKNLLRESMDVGNAANPPHPNKANLTAGAQNFLNAYAEFDINQGGVNTHLRTLLARSANDAAEYDLAIALLFDVIREKKDYRDAWILLGYAYLKTEKFQDAEDALEQARKLDTEKPETLFLLGLTNMGLKNFEKAAAYMELAKTANYQPAVHIDQKLAEIYLELQKYESAAQSYENVTSLNTTEVGYFIKPIWLYIDKLNQPQKALALANRALTFHPNNAMSYNLLGWASIYNQQYPEAEKFLETARAMNPNLDAVHLNFGILHEKTGNLEQAKLDYKKAHQLGRGNAISTAASEHYNQLVKP